MANARTAHRCVFQWDISNPFLPWRDLKATFYQGSPTVTQWRVTLKPMRRLMNSWKFSFALHFDEQYDQRDDVVVENVLVVIRLNGTLSARQEIRNFRFMRENQHTYYFETFATANPGTDPHKLVVRIEIALPRQAIENEEERGLFTNYNDLQWLSRDLGALRSDSRYSDIKLLPKNGGQPIESHSYMIEARWNNFFKLNDFEVGVRDTVETDFSEGILQDILTYMYSGMLDTSAPERTTPSYTAELFQVIDCYKLYHLYKVFAKNDLKQERVTRKHVVIECRLFRLRIVNVARIVDSSHTWQVNPSPEYDFFFQLEVRYERYNLPWVSYSLQSRSSSGVHAQVNLEVVRRVGEDGIDPSKISFFHQQDFTVDPGATVNSRRINFRDYPGIFVGSTSSDGREIRYFVRCYLNLSDGTAVTQIRNVDGGTLPNFERFHTLSDHMYKLSKVRVDADMRVLSHSLGPGGPHEYTDQVHKGIFAVRAPEYWEGLENVQPGGDLPEIARSTLLSSQTLPVVLEYMYTGKIFTIPFRLVGEIEDFAERTRFLALRDLVDRIRTRYMFR